MAYLSTSKAMYWALVFLSHGGWIFLFLLMWGTSGTVACKMSPCFEKSMFFESLPKSDLTMWFVKLENVLNHLVLHVMNASNFCRHTGSCHWFVGNVRSFVIGITKFGRTLIYWALPGSVATLGF